MQSRIVTATHRSDGISVVVYGEKLGPEKKRWLGESILTGQKSRPGGHLVTITYALLTQEAA